MKTPLRLSAILFGLALMSGCASYQLGTPENQSFASVYVKPVTNDSTYPLIETSLTSSLRKQINQSGSIATDGTRDADTVLEVTVVNAARDIAAVESSDVGRGRKFSLEIIALCSLYDSRDQNVAIFENREVSITQDIFTDSGQVNAEHQAGPVIARKLSERIANMLADAW